MIEVKKSMRMDMGRVENMWCNGRPVSEAFNSLSFRGNRGYSKDIMKKDKTKREGKIREEKEVREVMEKRCKTNIYGGILIVKGVDGKDRYALVQGRYTGKWSFPKGHWNEGETGLECTIREVGEETGIDELPEPSEYKQCGYGHYYIFNLRKEEALKPRDTKEIMNTRWVTLEEMEELSLNADASYYRKEQNMR